MPSWDTSSKATTVFPERSGASKSKVTSTLPSEASGVKVAEAVTSLPSASLATPPSVPSALTRWSVPVAV